MKIMMVLTKETKGTFVFSGEEDNTPVPTLYIKKEGFLGKKAPAKILVTIEEME